VIQALPVLDGDCPAATVQQHVHAPIATSLASALRDRNGRIEVLAIYAFNKHSRFVLA
jgi:hypothetical protein